MTQPLVSIGVVTYNHEAFIAECLDSIRAQDYPNLKVYVSDDASKDGTVAAVEAYMEAHPGFITHFYKQPQNLGISQHCNFLLDRLEGDYVQTFSGDDLMMPHKISAQVRELEKNPEAVFCFANMEWFWSDSGKKICNHFGWLQSPSTDLKKIIADCTLPTPSLLLRRSLLGETRYREDLKYVNDFYFIVELMQKALVVYLPEVIVRYRKHKDSVTLNNYFHDDRVKIMELFRANLPGEYQAAIRGYQYITDYALIMSLIQAGRKREALKLYPKLFAVAWRSRKWMIRTGAVAMKLVRAK